MNRITKLVSWVLLPIGVVSCSDHSDSTGIESSHTVTVTGIELENVDNGQPVPVGSEFIGGRVQIEP
jgi:hypothetical protein